MSHRGYAMTALALNSLWYDAYVRTIGAYYMYFVLLFTEAYTHSGCYQITMSEVTVDPTSLSILICVNTCITVGKPYAGIMVSRIQRRQQNVFVCWGLTSEQDIFRRWTWSGW